jgi:hypothetical protein
LHQKRELVERKYTLTFTVNQRKAGRLWGKEDFLLKIPQQIEHKCDKQST